MEDDFPLVWPEHALEYVMTKHAKERCRQRGFNTESVQHGMCATAVIVRDNTTGAHVVVTVLPHGATVHTKLSQRIRKREHDKAWKKAMRVLANWKRLTWVPECWEDRYTSRV